MSPPRNPPSQPRDPWDYSPLLRQWSREVLASDLAAELDVKPDQPAWLGTVPASEDAIRITEARLGISLPPSYRQFLLTSDGWGPTGPFIYRLRPASELAWFATENATSVEIWGDADDGGLSDAEYYSYEPDGRDGIFRGEHLQHTLQISDRADGDLLLNPRAVTPDGEWEVWFLASWIPGVRRFASFAHWLVSEYRSFRSLENVSGPEPALPSVTIPTPDIVRKASKPKRPKRLPRSVDDLLVAMASEDDSTRAKAVKEFAGSLNLRGRATRRPELIEPLTALFRSSPHGEVRGLCVQMLTQVAPDGEAPDAILEAFSDPDPHVVLTGIWARHYFPLGAAFEPLCRFIATTSNALIKDSAIRVLGDFGDPRAIPVILPVLHNRAETFDQIIGTAGMALALCGPDAIPHLIKALDSPDPRVRRAAVVGIDVSKDESAADHLRRMLDDPDEAVRRRTAMALRMRDTL